MEKPTLGDRLRYTFDNLMAKGTPAQRRLLREIDVLIDGPFIEELPCASLRGPPTS